MPKKLSEVELKVKNYQPQTMNYAYQRSISYSQYAMWASCPYKWYLTYVEKKQPYQASIHTVFGTAMHETMQDYITVMYNESGTAADKINLEELFTERFRAIYSQEYEKTKEHFESLW